MIWWGAAILAVSAALTGCLALARHRFVVTRVSGTSMRPEFQPGDRLVVRCASLRQLRAGSVVVFQEPVANSWHGLPAARTGLAGKRWVLKRVAALPGQLVPDCVRPATGDISTVPQGTIVVLGDDPESTDSRLWGFVPIDQVLGFVRWHFIRRGEDPGRRLHADSDAPPRWLAG